MFEALTRIRQAAGAQAQKVQLRMLPELLVGPGVLYDIPKLLRDQDIRCVMVVTTEGFVRRGVVPSFSQDLLAHGITAAVFSDVKPDPDIECVEMAAAFYRSHGCEGIVAIGGGSVMDCAKVAGALAVRPKARALDLVGTMKVHATLPYLVAVPTTAGTGSEVTAAAVVTDPQRQRKYAVSDISLIPDAAVLDPNLLVGLSPAMTAYTGMDALTHAVEAYTNRYGSREAREYARRAVEIIFKTLKASYDDGTDAKLREDMLMASYYAGIAFTNNMVGYVHALAHGIGGRYHVQHGLANAVLLPVVMEEFGEAAEGRLAELAEVIGLGGATDHDLACKFIAKIRELSESMGIPEIIPEIRQEDIPELAAGAEAEGNPAYPVPEIWTRRRFEKALKRVSSTEAAANAQSASTELVNGQVRIVKPGPLLNDDGMLAQPGFATSLLLEYDRSRIAASKLRVKEWDYYLVNDDDYALAFTVGDMGYLALVSASLLDFRKGTFITESTMSALPLGRMGMPSTSSLGVTQFADKRAAMTFEVAGGMRHLVVNFADFKDGKPLIAEIVLDREPRDSMVIATPWTDDDTAFYYNQKIVGMRAIGSFSAGDVYHEFNGSDSFGLLDWGRGVWTRDNTWFWGVAQGNQSGHVFAMNLGYGFGDTSAASENMVFIDGIMHKLGRVDFGIPVLNEAAKTVGDRYDLLKPWHITDDEGRLDLTFAPDIDRCDYIDLKAIVSDQHQVFGLFNGWVKLDDGSTFEVRDLRGSAEAVHNMY